MELIDFFGRNQRILVPLVAVLGSLAGIVFVVVRAVRAYTAVQAALNVVLTANPIGLIVVGIAALIAIIVVVATRTRFFQTVWQAAWGAIKAAAVAVFNWIKSHWPLLLGILLGPIGIAAGADHQELGQDQGGGGGDVGRR